jgi:hypothetical protein
MLLFVWQFVPVNPFAQTQLEKAPFAWVKHEPPFKQGFGEHPFVVTVVFISHNCPVKPFITHVFEKYLKYFIYTFRTYTFNWIWNYIANTIILTCSLIWTKGVRKRCCSYCWIKDKSINLSFIFNILPGAVTSQKTPENP